ncbi:citrulline utilization hydrolase CtlX [Maritalea sp.]|uniref:citrulline utilization hydrolase CtlX n=1 Tax=Maritalea sp. TaxID=2003361 RepID=UPI003EF36673
MKRRSAQAPNAIVMVRPHHFHPNTETAADNKFQSTSQARGNVDLAKLAFNEVTQAVAKLETYGVRVHLFDDESKDTPDSVFPNNWFSTHPGGHVAIYPMYATSRRKERRADVIEKLKRCYRVQEIVDYSGLEPDGIFLEGTGAMVLDHIERVAYAVRSHRLDPIALERFCTHFGYEPMVFDAKDAAGDDIYHTNVLMCIATEFVLISTGMIVDPIRRKEIVERFEQSGRHVIDLTPDQIASFLGNAIELTGTDGNLLVLSKTAHDALTPAQKRRIEKSAKLLPLSVPTIEMAGGSVRCMIAGIHLTPRNKA